MPQHAVSTFNSSLIPLAVTTGLLLFPVWLWASTDLLNTHTHSAALRWFSHPCPVFFGNIHGGDSLSPGVSWPVFPPPRVPQYFSSLAVKRPGTRKTPLRHVHCFSGKVCLLYNTIRFHWTPQCSCIQNGSVMLQTCKQYGLFMQQKNEMETKTGI